MIRKIPVVPEPDGTLRVICGEDILEIQVVKQQGSVIEMSGFRPGTLPVYGDGGDPIWKNPNDETIMLARPDRLDPASMYKIMSVLQQEYRDPNAANPRALVVGPACGIDLHGAVHFAGQVQKQFPNTHFSIDLAMFRGVK